MSGIRDVVARMAVDADFAEQVRAHPDEVAKQYGLSAEELDKVRGLADAESRSGPAPLGPRLSKSGIGAGGVIGLMASMGEAADQAAAARPIKMVPPKADLSGFEPQPDPQPGPPGDPHLATKPAAPLLDPPAREVVAGEQAGVGGAGDAGDKGLYPWPDVPDPFAEQPKGAPMTPDAAPCGPAAPGEAEGIIIVNVAPAPDAMVVHQNAPTDAQGDAMVVDDNRTVEAEGLQLPDLQVKGTDAPPDLPDLERY